jgi:hypothetical protein
MCTDCDGIAQALTEPLDPASPNGSVSDALATFRPSAATPKGSQRRNGRHGHPAPSN